MSDVVVVDYGAGNTRSVRAALTVLGRSSRVSGDPELVATAPVVVLPGVGSAASAMARLAATGVDEALRDRVRAGRRLVGICLGLQIALEWSAEDGGVNGLGIAPGRVERLTTARVPRLGWAAVEPWGETFYFAHSYAAASEATVATSDGITVAVAQGSFLGVQFHPEKSGPAGRSFLERWCSPV